MIDDGYYEEREHRCELLVRIIQSREGTPTKEEREKAFEELLEMFRPLIRAIASRVYRGFRHVLHSDFATFYHDTITTAIELVLADYVPKKYGGKAMFAPYLQTKLYFRTLYRAQRALKHHEREFSAEIAFRENDDPWTTDSGVAKVMKLAHDESIGGQLDAAILAQAMESKETIFETFDRHELQKRVDKLVFIAKSCLDEREHFVWQSTLFTGLKMHEIATAINLQLTFGENPWNKQRVYNYYHKIRSKVLSAYGEAALAGEV